MEAVNGLGCSDGLPAISFRDALALGIIEGANHFLLLYWSFLSVVSAALGLNAEVPLAKQYPWCEHAWHRYFGFL